jgi:hypothetical protein
VKLSCNECHKVLNTFKQERDYYKDLYNELCKRYNEEIATARAMMERAMYNLPNN